MTLLSGTESGAEDLALKWPSLLATWLTLEETTSYLSAELPGSVSGSHTNAEDKPTSRVRDTVDSFLVHIFFHDPTQQENCKKEGVLSLGVSALHVCCFEESRGMRRERETENVITVFLP